MIDGDGIKVPSIKLNIVLNFCYEILLILIPFITAPYLSRVLGAEGVGINSFSASLVRYFTMAAGLGTASYGKREIARSRDDRATYSKVFWEIEFCTVITSLLSLFVWLFLAFLYKEYNIYLLIYSLSIIAVLFDISWLYFGLEKYIYTIPINAMIKIMSVIAILTLVKSTADLPIYIFIFSGSTVLGNVCMWLFLPRTVIRIRPSILHLRPHFWATLTYFVPTIALTVYSAVDKTLIGLLIPGTVDGTINNPKLANVENGYYEQADKIISISKVACYFAINSVFSARMSYLYSKNQLEVAKQRMMSLIDVDLMFSVGGTFGLIAIADTFVPLFFGAGYEKTVLLLVILAPLLSIMCLNSSMTMLYYTPSGRRKQANIYVILGAFVNIVLSIPLVVLFKSVGAAIATIVAELIATSLLVYKAKSVFPAEELLKKLSRKLLAGGGLLVTVVEVNFFLLTGFEAWLKLCIDVCMGGGVYFLLLFVLGDSAITNAISLIRSKKGKEKSAR